MSDPTPDPPKSRFPWRRVFSQSATALFLIGSNRRLRFANAAWEQATGEAFAKCRGVRLPRLPQQRTLSGVLAPPVEVWLGKPATVRRALPGATTGPPWWDMAFTPLLDSRGGVSAVLGKLELLRPQPTVSAGSIPMQTAVERQALAQTFSLSRIVGTSLALQKVLSQVRAAAIGEMPVWIIGEPGTGKETVARVIHHNGPRRERSFLALHGGALEPYFIEAMLFGKGGLSSQPVVGTLYLTSPEKLPADLRRRVLQWVESARGPRLICSSAHPADRAVQSKHLEIEFVARYCAMELHLPPLRERLEDLPQIVSQISDIAVSADLSAIFQQYHWPGNLRELRWVLGGLDAHEPKREQLPRYLQERALFLDRPPVRRTPPPSLDEALARIERAMIQQAMFTCQNNIKLAAQRLGIPRTRLRRRLDELQPPPPEQP